MLINISAHKTSTIIFINLLFITYYSLILLLKLSQNIVPFLLISFVLRSRSWSVFATLVSFSIPCSLHRRHKKQTLRVFLHILYRKDLTNRRKKLQKLIYEALKISIYIINFEQRRIKINLEIKTDVSNTKLKHTCFH